MKQTLISFLFVSAFAGQALYQHLYGSTAFAEGVVPSADATIPTTTISPTVETTPPPSVSTTPPPKTIKTVRHEDDWWGGESESEDDGSSQPSATQTPAPVATTPAPATTPTPTPAPTPAPVVATPAPAPKPKGQYTDGTFVGVAADAYYGLIQVEAIISGGKITDVQFLQYPSDRSTSRMINSQAMPLLKQEAIAAQSANVNIVSGATDSSMAFRQSLSSALVKAKV